MINFPKLNSHKALKFAREAFPDYDLCYLDTNPLETGTVLSDGDYTSNYGKIKIEGGRIFKDGEAVSTFLVGIKDREGSDALSFRYYRMIEVAGVPYLINFNDYEKLVEVLEAVPV